MDIILKCSNVAPCSEGNESSGCLLMAESIILSRPNNHTLMKGRLDCVNSTETRLQDGRPIICGSIPRKGSLLPNFQTISEAHPSSYLKSTIKVSPRKWRAWGLKLTICLQLVLRLRMSGVFLCCSHTPPWIAHVQLYIIFVNENKLLVPDLFGEKGAAFS
jgi:hypothetical protein